MKTVSVIIPTVGRRSLRAAVKSIVDQVDCRATPIVVLDKPEKHQEVEHLLDGLSYELYVTSSIGAAGARNIGLDAARSDFVGYLDDDDLWLPEKAALQIRAIQNSWDPSHTVSVVESIFVREDGNIGSTKPRIFDPGRQTLAEHLVERRSFRYGSVVFNTPSLLGPRPLMQSIQWDEKLPKHEDWDLIVRLGSIPNLHWEIINQPLVEVYQGSADSLSALSDWQHGKKWLQLHDKELSGRARADFVCIHMLQHAVRERSTIGVSQSLKDFRWSLPHVPAIVRCIAGIILRR